MASPENPCIITAVDPFPERLLQHVSESIEGVYGLNTEVRPLLNDIGFAFDHNRKQYHSTVILDRLSVLASAPSDKIVALTDKDLFIPILTHVYGEAQLGGIACMVSSFRLREELPPADREELFLDRVSKEVLHELGHTYHLLHCKDKTCIMHYCRSIRDVDQKKMGLCRYCSVLLADQMKKG